MRLPMINDGHSEFFRGIKTADVKGNIKIYDR
jgi:hypothetical protein